MVDGFSIGRVIAVVINMFRLPDLIAGDVAKCNILKLQ